MRRRDRDRTERRAGVDRAAALRAWAGMVARGDVPAGTADLLDSLGDDAKVAWVRSGQWEHAPDTVDTGEAFPSGGSDDADPFRLIWIVPGWEVRPPEAPGGRPSLVHVLWSADSDGDWSCFDEQDFDSPGYGEWLAQGALETAEAWVNYLESVEATGEDPLGEVIGGPTQANVRRALRSAEKRLEQARFGLRRARAMHPGSDDDPAVEAAQAGDAKRVARLVEPRLIEARGAFARHVGDPELSDRVDVLRGVLEAARTGRARCPNCRRLLPGLKDKVVAMVEALRETTCHEVDPRGMAYDCA